MTSKATCASGCPEALSVRKSISHARPAVVWTNWTLNAELIRHRVQKSGDTPEERIEHAETYTLPRQVTRQ